MHRNFPLKSDEIPKAICALLALKPDIESPSWDWMAYPAHLLPCSVCSFSANLSKWIWVKLAHYFWWPVFCSRNLKWLRDLFTNFEQFLAQINAISIHIPFTKRACEFQSLWPTPLVLVLVERVPWVPVLPQCRVLIYLIVVSMRFETSSKWSPALFRRLSIFHSQA